MLLQTFNILESCTTNTAVSSLHISMLISNVSLQDSFIDKHAAMWTGNFTCKMAIRLIECCTVCLFSFIS